MRIAPLEADQLDLVWSIEQRDGDVGWSRDEFKRELQEDVQRFFVMMDDETGDVSAYGGYRKAGPEAQITNLVVRRESRCQGLGRRLLEFLLDCAGSEGCTDCTLEVREGNLHAQNLYRSLGFKPQGKRAKVYRNPEEDAVLMEKTL